MTAWRLLIDDGVGAADGLATDEALMRSYAGGSLPEPTLRLYSYRSHCALVGRFQDAAAELDLDACRATGTEVDRRPTGGGAIIMGEQQLGVALVTSLRHPSTPPHARAIIDSFGRGIVVGLARLGVRGEVRGKNDVAVNGRKIAGLGIYVDAHDAVLFHASVLADLDIGFMLRVLNIPAAKLADKGVQKVSERITTVSRETGSPVNVADLRGCVEAGFEEVFGISFARGRLTGEERAAGASLLEQRYGTPGWLRQRVSDAPTGSSILKTPGGLLRIAVGLSGNALKEVMISGDFMARERAVAEIEAALRWAGAERARVADAVAEGTRRGGGLEGVGDADLTEAVWQAVVDAKHRRGAAGSCYYPNSDPLGVEPKQEATSWR